MLNKLFLKFTPKNKARIGKDSYFGRRGTLLPIREFSMVNSSLRRVLLLSLPCSRLVDCGALWPMGSTANGSLSNPSTGVEFDGVEVLSIEKQLAKSRKQDLSLYNIKNRPSFFY